MHAMWVSVKENVKCGSKVAVVVGSLETRYKIKNYNHREEKLDKKLTHCIGTPVYRAIPKQTYAQASLLELDKGNASRNVVEMIFRKASMNPSNQSSKIKTVLRVKNPIETLNRFEKYRENVKKMSCEQDKMHPRSTVDGNELLRFYGTTIACCNEKSKRVSHELCKTPTCQLCRIIQSKFDTDYTKKKGILLSTRSDELSDKIVAISTAKKIRRAVIVCRIIAGECDLIRHNKGLLSNLEYLIVRNPRAILPCFVVVFA